MFFVGIFLFFWKSSETNYESKIGDQIFFQNGRLAAILDFADASKTIGSFGQTFTNISQNFMAIARGLQKLSCGNRNGAFFPRWPPGGHLGFRRRVKNNRHLRTNISKHLSKFHGNRSRLSKVIVRKPKRRIFFKMAAWRPSWISQTRQKQ